MWQIGYDVTQLVSRHRGTLPVVLTCPHDGAESPPKVPERAGQGLPASCDFSIIRDLHTRAITAGVAQRLLNTCGEAPYVVIAEFRRKYIDANREDANTVPNCAYEVPAAKQFYDEYHQTLREFVNEIRAESGGLGLLLDIHGTAGIENDPADVYLGTADGETVTRLLNVDKHAMSRRRSLPGFLEAAGYVVALDTPEIKGGYTVRTFGSSHDNGLDAIQIEIASTLRDDPDKRAALIDHVAFAIRNLVDRYASSATLASFQRADLRDGGVVQNAIAHLQRRAATNDSRLRLGGRVDSRGRLEIRHDPKSPRRAGVLILYDESGKDYYLWVDEQGALRIAASDPGSNSGAGDVVGAHE
jgi:N-formylglutamate amidohydrolase